MHDQNLTPVLAACMVGVFLFGVQSSQTLTYYQRRYKDPLYLKAAVLLMWLLEFAHSSVVFVLVYKCFITYFGDPDGLAKSQRLLSINGLVALLIAAVAQSYSAWRLYQLQTAKSCIIPVVCWVATVLRFIIYTAVVGRGVSPMPLLQPKGWRIAVVLVGVLSLAADLLIAVGLLVELWVRRHGNPVLSQSQALVMDIGDPFAPPPLASVVDQIILLCISTNVVTCISTLIAMILLYRAPSMYWMPVSYISSRLFSISFISLILQGRMLKNSRRPSETTTASQPQIPLQALGGSRSSLVAILPILCVSLCSANVMKNEVQASDSAAGLAQFVGPSMSAVPAAEDNVLETPSDSLPNGPTSS